MEMIMDRLIMDRFKYAIPLMLALTGGCQWGNAPRSSLSASAPASSSGPPPSESLASKPEAPESGTPAICQPDAIAITKTSKTIPIVEQPASASPRVAPTAFQEDRTLQDNGQDTAAKPEALPAVTALPAYQASLTLADLETIALANNPALAQVAAKVAAARGNWVQVGLPPNVQIGYSGSEIGNEGFAGQEGAYLSQQFVTGNKLGLNR